MLKIYSSFTKVKFTSSAKMYQDSMEYGLQHVNWTHCTLREQLGFFCISSQQLILVYSITTYFCGRIITNQKLYLHESSRSLHSMFTIHLVALTKFFKKDAEETVRCKWVFVVTELFYDFNMKKSVGARSKRERMLLKSFSQTERHFRQVLKLSDTF